MKLDREQGDHVVHLEERAGRRALANDVMLLEELDFALGGVLRVQFEVENHLYTVELFGLLRVKSRSASD